MRNTSNHGFTLIELLVVIAIIGILSSVVLASLNTSREKARVANTLAQIRELQKAAILFFDDTGTFPATCRLTCTAPTDEFLTNTGIPGWSGPYFTLWNFTHAWGGHLGYRAIDWDGDGELDHAFILDDDAPGTNSLDDSGAIPIEALQQIDNALDDGDLTTGNVLGNGCCGHAVGEITIRFTP